MEIKNAHVFAGNGFINASITADNGIITGIYPAETAGDDWVLPGLVDIHIHGSCGADFSDGDADGLRKIAAFLAKEGVTSFLPTAMTLPFDRLGAAFRAASEVMAERDRHSARIVGVRLEGPFISAAKKGAQNEEYIREPDTEAFYELWRESGGLIRIVDAAPEGKGACDFAREASKLCAVSCAHTACSYDEAAAFFDSGATQLTHLFNAMPPLLHRDPGPIGAASEREGVTAELICDGVHVHPSAVRAAFRLFPNRLCLISDANRSAGMPEGEYTLGGQRVIKRGGVCRLEDGTIAGSSVSLMDCLRNAARFGIPLETAVNAATLVPARAIGLDGELGSIAVGGRADLLICDRDLNIKEVHID